MLNDPWRLGPPRDPRTHGQAGRGPAPRGTRLNGGLDASEPRTFSAAGTADLRGLSRDDRTKARPCHGAGAALPRPLLRARKWLTVARLIQRLELPAARATSHVLEVRS